MNGPRHSVPDAARSRMRKTIATIERELALQVETTGAPSNLRASFADLVEQLALGPEPSVRRCPHCGGIGMRAATLCRHCWAKLTPPRERPE
jgi:hypothetical protein